MAAFRRPPEPEPDVRIVGNPEAPSLGEVRAVEAEPLDAEGPAAAVDEARVREAAPASPPPPSNGDRMRDAGLMAIAAAMQEGWGLRIAGRVMPAPDALDPLNEAMRSGWATCDYAIGAGLDPRKVSPFLAGIDLHRRISILVGAAQQADRLHRALDEAVSALEQYAGPLVMQAKAMMPDKVDVIEAGDAGRLAVRTLASIKSMTR